MAPAWRLLAGKTAYITGSTTGIDRTITLEYLHRGYNVTINHLGPNGPKDIPAGQLIDIACDITDLATGTNLVAEVIKKWGALDVFASPARRGDSIIGVSSISALFGGELQVHYTPNKAAVLSMIQSMAITLAKDNIRCNALRYENLAKKEYLEKRIPMGRVGRPEDIAGPAVFLASEALSGYMTGSSGRMHVHTLAVISAI
ncbi:hypothetical protein F4805DRAFT_468952 [Annulohypoxylon moriforme]|nr:hypothetical protein F4805DRAFT_468952 [Annulohypoxylon moriforme]